MITYVITGYFSVVTMAVIATMSLLQTWLWLCYVNFFVLYHVWKNRAQFLAWSSHTDSFIGSCIRPLSLLASLVCNQWCHSKRTLVFWSLLALAREQGMATCTVVVLPI